MYVAEYQMPGASSVADKHDAEPVKPKSKLDPLSREADAIIDGGKPLKSSNNLLGVIVSSHRTARGFNILIDYTRQLAMSRRLAQDKTFDPVTPGLMGVLNGTAIWFTITSATNGHAVAEIHGEKHAPANQAVSINPDDNQLALVKSHRPPPGPTWRNHTTERESLF